MACRKVRRYHVLARGKIVATIYADDLRYAMRKAVELNPRATHIVPASAVKPITIRKVRR